MTDDSVEVSLVRQALTATTFVALVDTLVSDFDVIDVLTVLTSRCVELLGVAAAGILLADSAGQLRVVGASNEQVNLLELFQIQNEDGPCLACFTTGQVVIESDMAVESRWPRFASESVAAGFPSVCAIPLRLKSSIIGCLNLFLTSPVRLSEADVGLAQALADVASIAVLQDQATREAAIREGHLQRALNSRIVVEQAKGMIAERSGLDMNGAFSRLRSFARNNNRGLTEVAEAVVAGRLSVDSVTQLRRPPRPGGNT